MHCQDPIPEEQLCWQSGAESASQSKHGQKELSKNDLKRLEGSPMWGNEALLQLEEQGLRKQYNNPEGIFILDMLST